MKLKTLKDIELFNDDLKDNIAKDEVKKEAIKWVKEGTIGENYKLMKFANITEEDLK